MNRVMIAGLVSTLFLLDACGRQSEPTAPGAQLSPASEDERSYTVMGEDLRQLRDDFNSNEGRVRLLFLSGPTCGICLRGMADLNDAFVAASQNDDRLVTFVVHVPTLGAGEDHVADTIPLLNGPRVHHYWEDSGIIGNHYRDVMEVDVYVWDFWAIYGPAATWEGTLPPSPDYYEHQLSGFLDMAGGFPRGKVLNAQRFAARTSGFVDAVDLSRFIEHAELDQSEKELLADGTTIPVVAQPRNVAVSQYIRNRGGYRNLKRVQAVEKRGHIEVGGSSYPLRISAQRPNIIHRSIAGTDRALPSALESKLLKSFEFDGLLVEWPDKGHELSMRGMQKIGDVLAWKLDLVQSGGQHWQLFINSHGGDLVLANMLDNNEQIEYSIVRSDFTETQGFKFAHRTEYVDRNGRLLGVEVIDEIIIGEQPFSITDETAAH